MQQQNIREYEQLRQELLSIKNCMTTYIGFVIGGSGAIIGFGAFSIGASNELALSLIPMILSLHISFVLFILLYKFNSHNRAAGYCKLLNHERHESPPMNSDNLSSSDAPMKCDDIFSWEICLDMLRNSDISPKYLIKLTQVIKVKGIDRKVLSSKIRKSCGSKPSLDKGKHKSGWKFLRLCLVREARPKTWRYPLFVVSVFFSLSVIFITIGLWFTISLIISGKFGIMADVVALVVASIVLYFQYHKWRYFIGKLGNLLEGSSTVETFFWKFLPIRARFLNEQNIIPMYIMIEEKIDSHLSEKN